MADLILYKNHCTPQEKSSFTNSDKWYLDSDCGRRLTGSCQSKTATAIGDLVEGTLGSDVALRCHSLYVKNTSPLGDDSKYILIAVVLADYVIKLLPGEAFMSDVGGTEAGQGRPRISGIAGTSYEYITGDAT